VRLSKKLAAIAITAGVALTASAAFAYWTSSGSGTGSATAGSDSEWVVASTTPSDAPLLTPGGPTDTINFSVTNASTGHQQLDSVEISVANADGTPWDGLGNCSAADFSVGGADAGDTYSVSPHADLAPASAALTTDTYSSTVSLQMVNRTDAVAGDGSGNQDDCRGVSVPLYISAS